MSALAKSTRPSALKDHYAIGEIPPLGHVPLQMHAWAIRKERHGPPESSMQLELLPTWEIGQDEVLVYVMAGGGNTKGGWARPGVPRPPPPRAKSPLPVPGSGAS